MQNALLFRCVVAELIILLERTAMAFKLYSIALPAPLSISAISFVFFLLHDNLARSSLSLVPPVLFVFFAGNFFVLRLCRIKVFHFGLRFCNWSKTSDFLITRSAFPMRTRDRGTLSQLWLVLLLYIEAACNSLRIWVISEPQGVYVPVKRVSCTLH